MGIFLLWTELFFPPGGELIILITHDNLFVCLYVLI